MKMATETHFRVQVEIFQKNNSILMKDSIKTSVKRYLHLNNMLLSEPKHIGPENYQEDEVLRDHVEFFEVVPSGSKWPIRYVVFRPFLCKFPGGRQEKIAYGGASGH